MYVVALVVLGSAELKACVSPSKKKEEQHALRCCLRELWQHLILFFCSALPLSEGLHSHRLGEKSCFYSLLIIAICRFLVRFWFFKLRQQEEKRLKPTKPAHFFQLYLETASRCRTEIDTESVSPLGQVSDRLLY